MEMEQFKLLRLQSQHLLSPAASEEVVSGMIGLQAQYGANALHALNQKTFAVLNDQAGAAMQAAILAAKHEGDSVTIAAPAGEREYEIVSVSYGA